MKADKSKNKDVKIQEEPLLEGRHHSGDSAEGEVCFDPTHCRPTNILVLKGDENLAADIKVAGFIIEDESDVLAEKLHEYFSVPVITGVPLARKILKSGEKIHVDGARGYIYETLPFSEQIGEIQMNFVTQKDNETEVTNITVPVHADENLELETELPNEEESVAEESISITPIPEDDEEDLKDSVAALFDESHEDEKEVTQPTYLSSDSDISGFKIDTETTVTSILKTNEEPEEEIDEEANEVEEIVSEEKTVEVKATSKDPESLDISRLLDLVEDTNEIADIKDSTTETVQGVDNEEMFNLWGKSLDRVISASKSVSPVAASEALEHVIEDRNTILENSKEIAFDTDEEFIAEKVQTEEENKKFVCAYVPTATKVYVNLIDEKLPDEFKNYDGIIFSSSYDKDVYLEMLEDTLSKAGNKEVLAITPPYESEALTDFFKRIHELRNRGYRCLSLILPDYRNKGEVAEIKKLLSSIGLKRSSTFCVYANVSRGINVFKINELGKSSVDGLFIDLFRLKMNMLGVEKLTASTRYAEGMKHLAEYLDEHINEENKSIINISGFNNATYALNHLLKLKFNIIATSLSHTDQIKKKISLIEKKNILESTTRTRRINLTRR